jgi:plastocyanin
MNGHRRWAWAPTILVVAVVFVPSSRARAATATVIERGTQYVPAQVDVAVGDTVQWIYESSPTASQGHTVTFDDRDLNPNCPPNLLLNDCQRAPSDRVSRTFTSAGTYPYRCKIQPGMTGVVVVSTSPGSSSTTAPASSTTATVKASTTTTRAATSSTTATTRALATSSTVIRSTTTTSDPSSALQPGEPPPLSGDGSGNAAGKSGSSDGGSDTSTVALIVGALLAASAGGGYLLWRLRPGRV